MAKRRTATEKLLDAFAERLGAMLTDAAGTYFDPLCSLLGNESPRPSAGPVPVSETPAGILGVSETAPRAVVDAAYRVQAAAAHPDKGGDVDLFKRLTAARDALYKVRGWK